MFSSVEVFLDYGSVYLFHVCFDLFMLWNGRLHVK